MTYLRNPCLYEGLGQYPPPGATPAYDGGYVIPWRPSSPPPGTWPGLPSPYFHRDSSGQVWALWGNTGGLFREGTEARPVWLRVDSRAYPAAGPEGGAFKQGEGYTTEVRFLHVDSFTPPRRRPPTEWLEGPQAPEPPPEPEPPMSAPDPGDTEPSPREPAAPDPEEPAPDDTEEEPRYVTLEGELSYGRPYAGVAQTHMMLGEYVVLPSSRYGSWNSLTVYNEMRDELRPGDRVRASGLEIVSRGELTLIPETYELLEAAPEGPEGPETSEPPGIIDDELEPGGDPWWLDAPPGSELAPTPPGANGEDGPGAGPGNGVARAGLDIPLPILAAAGLAIVVFMDREGKGQGGGPWTL